MVLAATYSFSNYWGIVGLSIDQMLVFHGAVNAFGFALPALLAWFLIAPPQVSSSIE
jgi:hypothetical protein